MQTINHFPGYEMVISEGADGKRKLRNMYRGVDVGMGGYVYAEHGIYSDVALIDVASMHPTSLILLNYFGHKYTPVFKEILDARLAIKHGDLDSAKKMMGGRLAKYLTDKKSTKQVSNALKIALNSQYGLSSSKYDLPQRDVRNVNNIVALRGALFIKTLQDAIVEKGYSVIHCKTDSIKIPIPNADQSIVNFCMEFGEKYGYTFEHEATFEKLCLITDADYVGKYKWAADKDLIGTWTATGAQFSHPYVFKTLFTREPINFKDLCETKSVTTSMYLDMNENLNDDEHDYKFVGRAGQYCPIKPGRGGGELLALRGDKYHSVAGTKSHRWLESCVVRDMHREDDIDMEYFTSMSDKMFEKISKYGDAEVFCSNNVWLDASEVYSETSKDFPIAMACGNTSCADCPELVEDKYHSDCAKQIDNTEYIMSKGE